MAYKEITSAINEPPVSLPAQGRPNTLYVAEDGSAIEFDPNGNGSYVNVKSKATRFMGFSLGVLTNNTDNSGENIDVFKRATGDRLMACNAVNDNVYISEDGGMSWSTVSTGSANAQYSILSVTEDIWIVVGASGIIYRTADGGSVWSSITSGTTEGLFGIGMGNGVIVISGGNGVVLRSTDDGASFSAVTSGITGEFLDDATYANGTWIIVGSTGTIIRSTDDAQTWSTSTTPNTNYYLQVDKSTTRWVASDDGGLCVVSDDDGVNWSALSHQLIDATAGTIGCIAKNDLVILGDGGTNTDRIFVSQDDGVTFQVYTNDTSSGMFAGFCEWYGVNTDGRVFQLNVLEL